MPSRRSSTEPRSKSIPCWYPRSAEFHSVVSPSCTRLLWTVLNRLILSRAWHSATVRYGGVELRATHYCFARTLSPSGDFPFSPGRYHFIAFVITRLFETGRIEAGPQLAELHATGHPTGFKLHLGDLRKTRPGNRFEALCLDGFAAQ